MTLPLSNGFDGGTSGTAITTANSGGASGNAWDAVSATNGAVAQYSSAQAAHGTLSGQFSTSATAGVAYAGWTASVGTVTTCGGRVYVYLTGLPAATDANVQFKGTGSSTAGNIQISTAGQILLQTTTFGIAVTFTTVLSLNTWWRIEWKMVGGAAGSASFQVSLFAGDSTTVTETHTDTANAWGGTGGTVDEVDFGWTNSHASQPAMYLDSVEVNATGMPGPDVPPAAGVPYLVQSVSGSVAAPSGIGTTAMSTAAGSWLAAFVGWNNVTSGTLTAMPSVSVTDSAGNLWQQCALVPAGSASTRAAVWCAANALPVSWVSVGMSGAVASASWLAAEIGGMPQDVQLDFSVSASGSGTAASLSWQASEGGIGLAVLGAGNSAETVASPPAGWTAAGTATASGGTAGTQTFAWWQPSVAAGSSATALSLGTAAPWSYALCSVKAAASPPPQLSQYFPRVVVEAAFGAQPGNIAASQDWLFADDYTTWTDITSRVLGPSGQGRIKTSRGRPYQLQQQEAGQMSATLANWDGAFTPTSPGSQFYSNALNANMAFQSGVNGYTAFDGASATSSSAHVYATGLNAVSAASLLLTPDGVTGYPGFDVPVVAVNQNYPYSSSAWVYCPAGWASGVYCQLTWLNASGSSLGTSTGAVTAVPAGEWTQVQVTGGVPPAGAVSCRSAFVAAGTPPSSTLFYFAEAAVVTGSSLVRTGLVAPLTPVRVTAWWLGRRYPVWSGYAQQWPQEWPDLPQWGFSTLKAADALAVAGAGRMQSALIGEVLSDNPYAYLPCSESYTSQVNGATPSNPFVFTGGYFQPADANGLAAVNQATGNQVTGTYLDGSAVQVSTGAAMNFLGDSGTGMGATSYNGEVSGQRGPSMLYADPGLSAVFSSAAGYTLEFWFTWSGTSAQNVTLLTVYSAPSAFMAPVGSANGACLAAVISGSSLYIYLSSGASYLIGAVAPSQGPQHVMLIAPPSGQLTVTLNGAAIGFTPNPGITSVSAVVLGPGRYSYDCGNAAVYDGYNFSAGHLAVYGYQVPFWRVTAHYRAGAAGWSGTDAATRFSQVMTWARLGMKRGGYNRASATGNAESTQAGPAYSLSGQSANSAVYALSQAEGGDYRTQANGSLVYRERPAGYNLPVSAVLADGTAPAPSLLNADPGFAAGAAGWTAAGGTAAASANRYGSLGSLQVTPSGTAAATASSPSFSYGGGSALAGFWVNCPAGGTVTCGAVTAAGTTAAAAAVSAGAWTFLTAAVPAAAGVSSAVLTASAGTAPFTLAWAALWNSPGQVPYDKKSSYGFDTTYIYNEVTATQQYGPSQLALYDSRGTASQAAYFRRSALALQSSAVIPYDVSDNATWQLGQFQQPALHVSAVTVKAESNPFAAFPVVLALDGAQVTQVNRSPVGGAPLTETGTVEKVQHAIGPGYWHASYQMSPYGPAQAVLSADTAGFDAPGTTPALVLPW